MRAEQGDYLGAVEEGLHAVKSGAEGFVAAGSIVEPLRPTLEKAVARTSKTIVSKEISVVAEQGAGAKSATEPKITSEASVPETIYRGAREGNVKDVSLRSGEEAVSFRDSLSNPRPEVGQKPQPVLKPGEKYIEVETSKLPPGSVVVDGGTQGLPVGHVSVKATPQEIISATKGSGKFPNLTAAEKEALRDRGLR